MAGEGRGIRSMKLCRTAYNTHISTFQMYVFSLSPFGIMLSCLPDQLPLVNCCSQVYVFKGHDLNVLIES